MSPDMTDDRPPDCTELRAALQDCEQRNADRAALIATTSHEIREPMNGVLGMARLLRDTPLDSEQRGYVDSIVDSAEALLTVINDILDLSRADAGQLPIAETAFDLPGLIGRVVASMSPRAQAKGLALSLEVAAGTAGRWLGDPGRVRQVLVNLVGNAVKFTEAGEVALTCAPSASGGVTLRVRDSGPGMPAAAFERLFTAYAQGSADTARLHGGSGLGLMIARRLAEAMGGNLRTEPGATRGTIFELTLPLRRAPAGWAARVQPPHEARSSIWPGSRRWLSRARRSGSARRASR